MIPHEEITWIACGACSHRGHDRECLPCARASAGAAYVTVAQLRRDLEAASARIDELLVDENDAVEKLAAANARIAELEAELKARADENPAWTPDRRTVEGYARDLREWGKALERASARIAELEAIVEAGRREVAKSNARAERYQEALEKVLRHHQGRTSEAGRIIRAALSGSSSEAAPTAIACDTGDMPLPNEKEWDAAAAPAELKCTGTVETHQHPFTGWPLRVDIFLTHRAPCPVHDPKPKAELKCARCGCVRACHSACDEGCDCNEFKEERTP